MNSSCTHEIFNLFQLPLDHNGSIWSSHSARRHVEAEAELVANHKKDLRLKVPRQKLLEEIIGRKQVGRMVGDCSSLATQVG
ncbi:hypothetical protein Tco_1269759, partial [Tanacetum coccineum]